MDRTVDCGCPGLAFQPGRSSGPYNCVKPLTQHYAHARPPSHCSQGSADAACAIVRVDVYPHGGPPGSFLKEPEHWGRLGMNLAFMSQQQGLVPEVVGCPFEICNLGAMASAMVD